MTREEMIERLERGEDPRQVSIKKWEDIKAGEGERYGSANCGLCAQYEANDCQGCPISTQPGKGCDIRPFKPWRRHADNNHGQSFRIEPGCEECQRLLEQGIEDFKAAIL